MTPPRLRQSAERFDAFFNRLTRLRLKGDALSPALAECVGHELSTINGATDLPPEAAPLWAQFLDKYLAMPGAPGGAPFDPLSKLRSLSQGDAEAAIEMIGEVQARLREGVKAAR